MHMLKGKVMMNQWMERGTLVSDKTMHDLFKTQLHT